MIPETDKTILGSLSRAARLIGDNGERKGPYVAHNRRGTTEAVMGVPDNSVRDGEELGASRLHPRLWCALVNHPLRSSRTIALFDAYVCEECGSHFRLNWRYEVPGEVSLRWINLQATDVTLESFRNE